MLTDDDKAAILRDAGVGSVMLFDTVERILAAHLASESRIDDLVESLCDCDAYRANDPEWHDPACPTGPLRAALASEARELDEARERLAKAVEERDSAQEHLAYHLRDFRPGADMATTGDLAVDMAAFAERMRAERDALRERLAACERLAEELDLKSRVLLRAALIRSTP